MDSPGGMNDAMAFLRFGIDRILNCLRLGYYILGENIYPLLMALSVPYMGINLNSEKRREFNFLLPQLRIRIEMAFGLLVKKWRIFKKPLAQRKESNINRIILSAMLLHNFIIDSNIEENGTSAAYDEMRTVFTNIQSGSRQNLKTKISI